MTTPPDDLDIHVRLELLAGNLIDILGPARDLVARLRARIDTSNTRSDLDYIRMMNGDVWERLGVVIALLEAMRNEQQKSPPPEGAGIV